jgi:K+-transporting ATPase ATPase C chain
LANSEDIPALNANRSSERTRALARLAIDVGEQLRPAVVGLLTLTILTGCLFPLVIMVLANWAFPRQAAGSVISVHGVNVGSDLIGQPFTKPGYFHPRPSAAGTGYDASSSGGTNYATSNPKLTDRARRLAEAYRQENGLSPRSPIPVDAVTTSGSGLDPDISPENAFLQIPRVARSRGLSEEAMKELVSENILGPQLGFLGHSRVSVLALNLQLDRRGAP